MDRPLYNTAEDVRVAVKTGAEEERSLYLDMGGDEDADHVNDTDNTGDDHCLPLEPLHHYRYPLLASDRTSFAKARADPLACNINNEMVLLWKDITIEDDERVVDAVSKPLHEASVEEVLGGLFAVAKRHQKDLERAARDKQIQSYHSSHNVVDNTKPAEDHLGLPKEKYIPSSENQGFKYLNIQHDSNQTDPSFRDPNISKYSSGYNNGRVHSDSPKTIKKTLSCNCDSREDFCLVEDNTISQLHSDSSRFDSGHFESSGEFFNSTSGSKSFLDVNHTSDSSLWENEYMDHSEQYPDVFVDEDPVIPEALQNTGDDVLFRNRADSHNIPVVNVQETVIKCQNVNCGKKRTLEIARNSYKNCHNCLAAYCSRQCRREDWKRHKEAVCHGSRVNSACKRVIKFCNCDPEVKDVLSRIARRGYMANGRGCVMLGLPDLSAAQEFLEFGPCVLELNPIYVTFKELKASKMYADVLEKLLILCEQYNPAVKFVLNVGVGVRWNRTFRQGRSFQYGTLDSGYGSLNRTNGSFRLRSGSFGSDGGYSSLNCSLNGNGHTSSSVNHSANHLSPSENHGFFIQDYSHQFVRHKGPILQKCIKLKLSPARAHANGSRVSPEEEQRLMTTRYGPTLILSGIPGGWDWAECKRQRELCFINIQRKLRQRGVNLRHQFPDLYAALVNYVKNGTHFPSEIIFPVDTIAKKWFMCVLMPEAEPNLDWTQSDQLLDDLDISKESIWGSMSRSRSHPSSLHLCDSGTSFLSEKPSKLRHVSARPHDKHALVSDNGVSAVSTLTTLTPPAKYSSSPQFSRSPNIATESKKLSIETTPLSPLHVDFADLPYAASSPKHPKSWHPHHHAHHRHHHHHHQPHQRTPSPTSTPSATTSSFSPRHSRLSQKSIRNSKHKQTPDVQHLKATYQEKQDASRKILDFCANPVLSPEYRRKFNTNSPYFPAQLTFEQCETRQSTNSAGDFVNNCSNNITSMIASTNTNDYAGNLTSSVCTTQSSNLFSFVQSDAPSSWPPSPEYVNNIVNKWTSSSTLKRHENRQRLSAHDAHKHRLSDVKSKHTTPWRRRPHSPSYVQSPAPSLLPPGNTHASVSVQLQLSSDW